MSAFDDLVALTRGKDYGDIVKAWAGDVETRLADLIANGLTSAVIYGVREISQAVDLALVKLDSKVQLVTMTAADKAVSMPDATDSIVEGQPWLIANDGALAFSIKDNAGGVLVAAVMPGDAVSLRLTDNATAAGAWRIFGRLDDQPLRVRTATRLALHSLT